MGEVTEATLRAIFDRTSGHCHFCGDPIVFENRGWVKHPNGHWEIDHVIQRHKGGLRGSENCLPACTRCNRLRWHRTGDGIRELLFLGVLAVGEIKRGSETGRKLNQLRKKRLAENLLRRSADKLPRV
jgi:5-methylcytosine-specific restriction endonuclease McrA